MPNSILSVIADNAHLFDALKEVMRRQFDLDEVSLQQSDEEMGQVVRARITGLRKVEEGFKEIALSKSKVDEKVEPNPAR